MAYVDGFVLVVPNSKKDAYKKMATLGCTVWREHGALDYKECWGDDMTPEGIEMPFPKLAHAGADESVVFAFIVFKNRAHRDEVNAKVMKDPRMDPEQMKDMPFDMKKMSYGGFEAIVDASSSADGSVR